LRPALPVFLDSPTHFFVACLGSSHEEHTFARLNGQSLSKVTLAAAGTADD